MSFTFARRWVQSAAIKVVAGGLCRWKDLGNWDNPDLWRRCAAQLQLSDEQMQQIVQTRSEMLEKLDKCVAGPFRCLVHLVAHLCM